MSNEFGMEHEDRARVDKYIRLAPKLAEALRAVSESAGKTHLPHRGAVYVVPPDVIEAARTALAEWDAQS